LKSDPKGALQSGLIAEEVAKVYPALVIRDESGRIDGVRYDELAPMLLNEAQKRNAAQDAKDAAQNEHIAAQAGEIRDLKQQLASYAAQLRDLQRQMTELHAAMMKPEPADNFVAER
jgi:multidrug resistance efflux pump